MIECLLNVVDGVIIVNGVGGAVVSCMACGCGSSRWSKYASMGCAGFHGDAKAVLLAGVEGK